MPAPAPGSQGKILKAGAMVGVFPKQGSGMRRVPLLLAQTGQLTATNTRFRAPNPCPAALQAPHPSCHHSLPSSRLRLLPQELLFFPYLGLLYQEPFSPFIIVSLPSSPWGRLHLGMLPKLDSSMPLMDLVAHTPGVPAPVPSPQTRRQLRVPQPGHLLPSTGTEGALFPWGLLAANPVTLIKKKPNFSATLQPPCKVPGGARPRCCHSFVGFAGLVLSGAPSLPTPLNSQKTTFSTVTSLLVSYF